MKPQAFSHQLTISSQAHLRSKLRAQPGRRQNPRLDARRQDMKPQAFSHQLTISSQAHLRSKSRAQPGRRQNPFLMRGGKI